MALTRICLWIAVMLALLEDSSAETPPGPWLVQDMAAGPMVPQGSAGPLGRLAVSPGPPPSAISAADALELAVWARQQAASHGGDVRDIGISLEDALELEAWARQQAEREPIPPRVAAELRVQHANYPRPSALPSSTIDNGGGTVDNGGGLVNPRTFQTPPGYYPPGFREPRSSFPTAASPGNAIYPAMQREGSVNLPAAEATDAPEMLPQPTGLGIKADCEGCEEECMWGCCWRQWCQAGLVGGVELAFLGPLGEPGQSVTQTNLVTGQAFTGITDPGVATGVRVTLGVQHAGGFGYRARYGHLGADYIDLDPTVPVIVDGQTAFREEYSLRGDTLDLELTHRYCLHHWVLDASFGSRYARLERNAMALGYGMLGSVDLTGLAVGANELEGAGFTFSLAGTAPVGLWWSKHHSGCDDEHTAHPPFDDIHNRIASCAPCFLSGWRWFWGIRGSLLWADTAASAFTEANAVVRTPTGTGSSYSRDTAFASENQSDNVFIGEAVLGLQWEHCCQCLPAVFYFRTGLEYQHWETGNVRARSNSFAFMHDGPDAVGGRVDAVANAHDGDLDLFGFMIGFGLTY